MALPRRLPRSRASWLAHARVRLAAMPCSYAVFHAAPDAVKPSTNTAEGHGGEATHWFTPNSSYSIRSNAPKRTTQPGNSARGAVASARRCAVRSRADACGCAARSRRMGHAGVAASDLQAVRLYVCQQMRL